MRHLGLSTLRNAMIEGCGTLRNDGRRALRTLQDLLVQTLDAETEQALADLLQRKVASAVGMLVQAVRAAEDLYGPGAGEAIRQRMLERSLAEASEGGVQVADRSLRAYCQRLERGCRGSHEWIKIEDTDVTQAYRFTRCLWADVFRALGASDIGLWICSGDGPAAAAVNPRIRFRRTKTLMAGDDCCDHVYYCQDDAGQLSHGQGEGPRRP